MRISTRRRAAFTLPGLASAVALTGLLGLFLAPLVVQLKAQQESNICLNNIRRLGQATLMYVQDYDQTMPLTASKVRGRWQTNQVHVVPFNWSSSNNDAVLGSEYVWPNTVLAYGISIETLKCPSQEAKKGGLVQLTYNSPLARPVPVGYSMNGLLTSYLLTSIPNPSRVPLIWEGRGRSGYLGGVVSNPFLSCTNGTLPCRFDLPPVNGVTNGDIGGMMGLDGSVWTHGRSNHWLFVDGHVEARKLGTAITPKESDPVVDPFNRYNDRGVPDFYHTDGRFPPLFRPDR
jgi:prepilin-type processing-associated H-X9-DG protein